MRIERIEGVLSGSVYPISRNLPRNITKQETKKPRKLSGTEEFAALFEKATAKLAKSLTQAGKVTYERLGIAKNYDEVVGTMFDEKV